MKEKEQIKDDLNTIRNAINTLITNTLKFVNLKANQDINYNNDIQIFNETFRALDNANFTIGELLSIKYRLEAKLHKGENK